MTASHPETTSDRVPPSGDFAFDRETAIEKVATGRWSAALVDDWNIRENPNGGYALSPLLRAMAAEVEGHPDPVSVTTHFLRPAVGKSPADLSVDVVRSGRRMATVRGSMGQVDKPRLEALATFSDLSAEPTTGFSLDIEPPEIPEPDACIDRLRASDEVDISLMSRVEVRLDPAQATSLVGSEGEPGMDGGQAPGDAPRRAEVGGWMRFLDGREPDSRALVLFADCFPPSVFNAVGRTGWIPTIELTVHVRRRPVSGWIQAQFRTKEVAGDLLIEDGVLWDESGKVVAQSRQLALTAI